MKSVIALITICILAVPSGQSRSAETSDDDAVGQVSAQTLPKFAAALPTAMQELKIQEDLMILTVDKKTLTAELKTWPEDNDDAETLKSFKIAIGKAEGDKLIEGDNKTPEGIYLRKVIYLAKSCLKNMAVVPYRLISPI